VPVLQVEHDLDRVFTSADRVTMMNEGKVLVDGTADYARESQAVREVYVGREPRRWPRRRVMLLRHQAALEIASEIGRGSTFAVRLPARRVERAPATGDAFPAAPDAPPSLTSTEARRETGS
jgi:ABC-type multidrug transport system ATPase subunit